MSEKQINTTEDNKFLKRAVATAAGLGIIGTGAWAVGANIQNENKHELAQEKADSQQAELEKYHDSIETVASIRYPSTLVLGEINVTQDSNIIDGAELLLKTNLGDQYNDIKSRIYSPLLDSAKAHNPQPGEKYSLVEIDINPEEADGTEYIIVNSDSIMHPQPSLPSPVIEDSPSNKS